MEREAFEKAEELNRKIRMLEQNIDFIDSMLQSGETVNSIHFRTEYGSEYQIYEVDGAYYPENTKKLLFEFLEQRRVQYFVTLQRLQKRFDNL